MYMYAVLGGLICTTNKWAMSHSFDEPLDLVCGSLRQLPRN